MAEQRTDVCTVLGEEVGKAKALPSKTTQQDVRADPYGQAREGKRERERKVPQKRKLV